MMALTERVGPWPVPVSTSPYSFQPYDEVVIERLSINAFRSASAPVLYMVHYKLLQVRYLPYQKACMKLILMDSNQNLGRIRKTRGF